MFQPRALIAAITIALLLGGHSRAQVILRDHDDPDEPDPTRLVLPYPLYTPSLGFVLGVGGGTTGFVQPQLRTFATLYAGTNESLGAIISIDGFRPLGTDRMFVDGSFYALRGPSLRAYVDGNPDFADERAGSNVSDPDDFIDGLGHEIRASFTLRYTFALGDAREEAVQVYRLQEGLPADDSSGPRPWNPIARGRTALELQPFYYSQVIEYERETRRFDTSGFALRLSHDNTDFPFDPSRGSEQSLAVWQDFGWVGSDESYTWVEAELSKYLSLGKSSSFRRRVLALNFWTANTITWSERTNADGETVIRHRPPHHAGPRLGGFYRHRAYPSYRYHDRSALYYTAELRLTPHANPMRRVDPLDLDWFQWVGFAEIGRVADTWNLAELHSDLKWSAGVGLRTMLRKIVLRGDIAVSPEGPALTFAVGHPF